MAIDKTMAIKVLVADDSATIQKVIRIAFSQFDVDVIEASSFVEALRRGQTENPAIIIIDAKLVGTRSPEDFENLQETSGGCPVLLLVGSYESVDEGHFQRLGLFFFLKKPFDTNDVIQKITAELNVPLTKSNTLNASQAPVRPSPARLSSQDTRQTEQESFHSIRDTSESRSPNPNEPSGLPDIASFLSPQLRVDHKAPPNTAHNPDDSTSSAENILPSLPHDTMTNKRPIDGLVSGSQSRLSPRVESQPYTNLLREDQESALASSSINTNMIDPGAKGRHAFGERESFPDSIPNGRSILSGESENFTSEAETASHLIDQHTATNRSVDSSEHSHFNSPSSNLTPDQLRDIITPMIREELRATIKETIQAYCTEHFAELTREVVLNELRRLAEEKSRHLASP